MTGASEAVTPDSRERFSQRIGERAAYEYGFKEGAAAVCQRAIAVIGMHYLASITCDHERKLDKPACACSLVDLGWHPSVGLAVEAWIKHVADLLDGAP